MESIVAGPGYFVFTACMSTVLLNTDVALQGVLFVAVSVQDK
jgi:hypothetical protein